MRPSRLDEYPIHQAPLSMSRVATSDRNFYDRCYFNALDRAGTTMVVAGAGVYPNLGVHDAFLAVRTGDVQHVVRFSDALDDRVDRHRVGGFEVEVVEPLRSLRVACDGDRLSADLTWEASIPALLEQPHLMMGAARPTLDAQRFAQTGSWSGSLTVEGTTIALDRSEWLGSRDRSWGIRPVGDPDPAGRDAAAPLEGFWWLYAPLRFDDFTVVLIVQERPDGFRTLNDASRIFADGRVEQLGWPRVEVDYRPGSRTPVAARIHLTTPTGEPLLLEVEPRTFVPLHIGCGYGGDPEWAHGQWRGRSWTERSTYDLTDPEVAGRIPWGVTDFSARARIGEAVGYGLFEHASMGRHDPSGFADWSSVAPEPEG